MRLVFKVPVGTLGQYRPYQNEDAIPKRKRTEKELTFNERQKIDCNKPIFKLDEWHLWVIEGEKAELWQWSPKLGKYVNGMD